MLQQHFYQILRVSSLGIFNYFPVKDYFANIVPVDELANCIVAISSNTLFKNGNYHAFSSRRIPLEEVCSIFKHLLGISELKSVSSSQIPKLPLTPAQKIILRNLFSTFNGYAKLDSKVTERLLRKYGFTFSKIGEDVFYKTFNYLTDINFFKNNNVVN